MPGATDAGSIRTVLTRPAVARTFGFALVGRLTYGLLPLCFLFTVRDASGSFAVAATAMATFGFATMAMPLQARLLDRYGQRRVLPCYAACFVITLLTTSILSAGDRSDATWVALGLLSGLSVPALGPAMRGQWREIAEEGVDRRVAYSIDSIGEESLYLVGPLAASIVLLLGPARAGLVLAAVLIAVGTAALMISPYVPDRAPRTRRIAGVDTRRRGPMRSRQFRHLLLPLFFFGAAGAACFLGIASLADQANQPGAVGLIEAAMAVGAIGGGLAWSRLTHEPSWTHALVVLLLVAALAQVGASLASPSLVLVGTALAASGVVAAPIYVVAFTASDALTSRELRTEASSWVSTTMNVGNAVGTAVAGSIAGPAGAAPFILSAALCVAAALILAWLHRSRPTTTRPSGS
jgi:MFS family permease